MNRLSWLPIAFLTGCAVGGYAPPPPAVVVVEPVMVPVGAGVYYVQNAPEPVYLYAGIYYCRHSGYWYRAESVSGAYVHIGAPPRPVLDVPQGEKRHGPPDRRGHGHGRGHE